MADYEIGTIAVATVRGVPNVRVMRSDDPMGWVSSVIVKEWVRHELKHVTDIRPLVVLDFAHASAKGTIKHLRERHDAAVGSGSPIRTGWSVLADQIEEQTRPPRISEPNGAFPVVEAHTKENADRLLWTHVPGFAHRWYPVNADEYGREWDQLVNPVVIREGVPNA